MVSDLKDKHRGEEAWLFAKGEGLDYFDFNEAGVLRATVNHACHVVPNPTYCFSWHVAEDTDPCCPFYNGEGEKFVDTVENSDIHNDVFFKKHSSLEVAVSYMIYTGISKLHIVGMNPEHGYSQRFSLTDRMKKYSKCFTRGYRSFNHDKEVRRSTRKNCLALLKKYEVTAVEHTIDLPPSTLRSEFGKVADSLSQSIFRRYDKWNKKAR